MSEDVPNNFETPESNLARSLITDYISDSITDIHTSFTPIISLLATPNLLSDNLISNEEAKKFRKVEKNANDEHEQTERKMKRAEMLRRYMLVIELCICFVMLLVSGTYLVLSWFDVYNVERDSLPFWLKVVTGGHTSVVMILGGVFMWNRYTKPAKLQKENTEGSEESDDDVDSEDGFEVWHSTMTSQELTFHQLFLAAKILHIWRLKIRHFRISNKFHTSKRTVLMFISFYSVVRFLLSMKMVWDSDCKGDNTYECRFYTFDMIVLWTQTVFVGNAYYKCLGYFEWI